MTSKQRTWGQFATPTDVADLLLGFCLRRPTDRLLDPSCGEGALLRRAAQWQTWLSPAGAGPPGTLFGIELDAEAAARAEAMAGVTVARDNFLGRVANPPYSEFDAVVGNPPYTRAEWIHRLDTAEAQLSLFPDVPARDTPAALLLSPALSAALSRRAGLYAYFFLHAASFLRPGGRLGFVVPNGWLDVAYGTALKQFLLDHYRILAVIESSVERWFEAADVNTCLVILERAGDTAARAANRVRLVRLRRPLRDLLGHRDGPQRVAAVEQLLGRLLPAADRRGDDVAVRVRQQGELAAADRWGTLLRAPDVALRPAVGRASAKLTPLGRWATLHRGVTTGANSFFYLDPQQATARGIEPQFRRPLLKSLRDTDRLHVVAADCRHDLLTIAPGAAAGTIAGDYLAEGQARGIDRRVTCAARHPWYALPEQPAGALLLAKGVWQRHFAPVVEGALAVDQQIYRLSPVEGVSPGAAAALLNSAWFALQCELRGRVNLGDGVLWLAAYELAQMPLPDPRALDAGRRDELAARFDRLAALPLSEAADLRHPDRWALDEFVFDLLGLAAGERDAARAALGDRLAERRERARHVAHEAAP